jgi:hypothetical protein
MLYITLGILMHVYAYYVYRYCIIAVVEAWGMCTGVRGSHMYWYVDMFCLLYALLYFPCSPPSGGGGEGYYC